MDNQYHQRVVVINYNQKTLPKFETQAELDEWHRAVGRMLCYGLINEAPEDGLDLVVGTISDRPTEFCCGYYPAIPTYQERWSDGSTKVLGSNGSKVEELVRFMKQDRRPLVMGAVLHSDGKFGFHS